MRSTIGIVDKSVVTYHDPTAIASEAYRVLRTNLQFMGLDEPLKSILISSASPAEGKSTTVANLAVAFAQTGARVCVVDADLRRPTQSKLFGLDNWRGLTTVLIGQEPLGEGLRSTAISELSVLPSGPVPPNPAELLASKRMTAFLEQLEEQFDVVLIDTPPVLAVTDPAVLAPKAGGVILVARVGQVARQQLVRAREAMEAVQARMLGVVLTAVKPRAGEGYYYYYGSQRRRRRN